MFIKPFTPEKIAIKRPDLTQTIPLPADAQGLSVNVVGGNLSIEAGEPDKVKVAILWNPAYPLPQLSWEDNTLCLVAQSTRAFIGQQHPYAYNLKVPPSLPIHVRMKAGVINLEGLHGPLDIAMTMGGNLEASVSSTTLQACLTAGDIRVWGMRAQDVDARTYLGNVEMVFEEILPQAHLHMRTYLGDVKARFPQNFAPRYHQGYVHNSQDVTCRARTVLGDVTVDTHPPTP